VLLPAIALPPPSILPAFVGAYVDVRFREIYHGE